MLRLFAHGAGAAGGKGLLGEAFAPGVSLVYPKETAGGDHQCVTGFLLEELQRRLELPYLLCTRHNPKTGRILGQNCRGEEKVRRFHRAFPGVQVVDVYSDSLGHDKPIFGLATGACYHVTGHAPHAFNYRTQYKD